MNQNKGDVMTAVRSVLRNVCEQGRRLSRYGRVLLRKCGMPLAVCLIIIAVIISLFRALTPWATQYKGEVESHLSALLGQPVDIGSMETGWYWFEPVLKLNQVTVSDSRSRVVTLNKLLVGIDLLGSLWHWQIQPGMLYVDDVHLTLRQVKDTWQLDGLRPGQKNTTLSADAYVPALHWLLLQQKIMIKNVSVLVHLSDGTLLPFDDVHVTAVNRGGHYRLRGEATLAQTEATQLLFLADMTINSFSQPKLGGHFYLSAHHFLPMQWRAFFPKTSYHLEGGKGDFQLWLDMRHGHISSLQTTFHFRRVAWGKDGNPKSQFVQSVAANLAWHPNGDGWKISGDHIRLRTGDIRWPDNAFFWEHASSKKNDRLFVSALLLEPIMAADIDWPDVMKPLLALRPHGQLYNTDINVHDGELTHILTRFDELGWHHDASLPAVSHVSGVLDWQPSEGHLALDGEHTTVTPNGLPPLALTDMNAAFQWKKVNDDWQVAMDRLILRHPDFVVSAAGTLAGPLVNASPRLALSADFSLSHARQWFPYIPSAPLKAKLYHWLQHDIKRIDNVTGELTVNGAWADFPFDNGGGVFSIVSHLTGVDLYFNRRWPVVRDIEAYLQVNQRTLTADVRHAVLQEVAVDNVGLSVADMGLNKETLLVHGKVSAPVDKLKQYVLVSPLKKPLAKLNTLDLLGMADLDLNLEVPLYPENDDVLVRGEVAFHDNEVILSHVLNDLRFQQLNGTLFFNEQGATDSKLQASLLDEPVNVSVRSINQPKAHTVVDITGYTRISALQKQTNWPLLPFLSGRCYLDSQLTLTRSSQEPDHLIFKTSLQGVPISLPKPFGKSVKSAKPLTVRLDFNTDKRIHLQWDYANTLAGDLLLSGNDTSLVLDKGAIKIGGGKPSLPNSSGLFLAGTLDAFDVSQWQEVWDKASSLSSSSLTTFPVVSLKIGTLTLLGKSYQNVGLQVKRLPSHAWSLQWDHKDLVGNTEYQPDTHTLSGHLQHLYLTKSSFFNASDAKQKALKPGDIPNLDLSIDTLKWGDVDAGSVVLKSKSTPTKWHLESFRITSPDYLLALKGDWVQDDHVNKTDMRLDVTVTDLGKSLARWQWTPAVDAHKGSIALGVTWPGAVYDYAISKMNGDMYMTFENGRITHLSPETEEKLGLGKLLSILSLQTIPRRLKLDFSDLSHSGYSFDVFKGNFILRNGVLTTTDGYMDGPVAYAGMKGDLDVDKQRYNLELHISPHITASLPIVATIAGGPIAGLATWAASKIINQGMQRVTGYTYKVTGPWLDPVVEQVTIKTK